MRPAPLRKRLWQGAGAVALILCTFLVGNLFLPRDRALTSTMLGHDFLAFYTAGTFARTGQFDRMYDLPAVREFQTRVAPEAGLELGSSIGPFWNPPFFAWICAPLSWFSLSTALSLWTILNLTALASAIVLLCRMLPQDCDWRSWSLLPVLLILSMPLINTLTHGQNTLESLLLLTAVVWAWRGCKPVLAGLLCGLLFYKPQLALVVAAVLVLNLGLRVCLGLAFALGSLCLITAVTMPDAIGHYLHNLPINLHAIQVASEYMWERHVTLAAFWRLLMQGRGPGDITGVVQLFTIVSSAALVAGLGLAIWRDRRAGPDDIYTGETRSLRRDRIIAATITSMPLLMPFYFDYDLLLLSIPAVLFASELMLRDLGAPLRITDRALLGGWVVLYLCLMINPAVGAALGVNLAVVLLGAISLLQIHRACQRTEPQQLAEAETVCAPQIIRVVARRAA